MNATEYCKHVENRLGWEPPAVRGQPWAQYRVEAAKVKRKIATNPSLYTWDNLLLAVELLARERQPRTPIGVFVHVERALERQVDVELDVETEIRKVIAYEQERGDPHGWATLLSRASGSHRAVVLEAWRGGVL